MSILVAFDTVFEQCSVAIININTADNQYTTLYHETVAGNRGQTQVILPMIEQALAQTKLSFADVSCWACNRGPGAFSGIRINTAVVQALSVANDAPCVGVSSLLVLADCAQRQQNFQEGTTIFSAIDARQSQVYLGEFVIKNQCAHPVHTPNNPYLNERLLDYDAVVQADVLVTQTPQLVQTQAQLLDIQPTAEDIARLAAAEFLAGRAVMAEQALPVYLRDDAWKTLAQQGKA